MARGARGGVRGGGPATWRTRGGAAAHAEVAGAAKGAIGALPAAASASSSSAASAQVRVPSRMPRMIGSVELKGEMVLKRLSSPLEPSSKLSAGCARREEVME